MPSFCLCLKTTKLALVLLQTIWAQSWLLRTLRRYHQAQAPAFRQALAPPLFFLATLGQVDVGSSAENFLEENKRSTCAKQ